MHHAYRHGLLEHSVVVAEVAAAVADRLPTVDRDLVVAGALLHDLGKVVSYSSDPFAPGFTDAGRLHGEIVLGHDMVRGLVAEVDGFPEDLSTRLRHVIVAHHGEKEKGSPVVPMTREAVVVHYCDDMTARVAAVDDAERATAAGDRWSPYSRCWRRSCTSATARTPPATRRRRTTPDPHRRPVRPPADDAEQEGGGEQDGPPSLFGSK